VAAPVPAAESQANAVFLIAKREMGDPNFRETVVLVTHPPRGGPLGVIINRPLVDRLSDVFPDQPSLKGSKEVLYFGGPVARQGLVFLVRSAKPPQGVLMVLRDVFFTSDVALIEKLLQRKDPLAGLRIFAGYSGWAPGQLQNELARGGWHVVPADSESVFDKDPAALWPELIERATSKQTRKDEGGRRKAEGGEFFSPSLLVSHHQSPITHHAVPASGAMP
jgi:putative transcriptional regulator